MSRIPDFTPDGNTNGSTPFGTGYPESFLTGAQYFWLTQQKASSFKSFTVKESFKEKILDKKATVFQSQVALTESGKNFFTYLYDGTHIKVKNAHKIKNIPVFDVEVTYLQGFDIEGLVKEFKPFLVKRENLNTISVMCSSSNGLYVKSVELPKTEVDIPLNYGTDFKAKHDLITKKLIEKRSGIYIFHGEPGTGKTTYIKHLASLIDKRFIYISESISSSLDGPQLTSVLIDEQAESPSGLVLIIEDAEKLIKKRRNSDNNIVSTILNMSDGILSNIFSTSIILTYNTLDDEDKDPAITRLGRLRWTHKFGALTQTDAQNKIDALGFKYKANKEMTLAEIYNLNEETGLEEKEERKIGFKP